MALPNLLKEKAQPLAKFGAGTRGPASGAGGVVTIAAYPAHAQYQILSEWCWNAVGSAISTYYLNSGAGDRGVQCKNATEYLSGASSCCKISVNGTPITSINPLMTASSPMHYNINPNNCNQPGYVSKPVKGTGKLNSWYLTYSGNGPNSSQAQDIVKQMSAGNPAVMRIGWNGGGGHVVGIYGTNSSSGTLMYYFADPWSGDRIAPGAPSGGAWTGSYFNARL